MFYPIHKTLGYFEWLQKRSILYRSCEFIYEEIFNIDVVLRRTRGSYKTEIRTFRMMFAVTLND